MILKDYIIINSETKKAYAQTDSFPKAVEIANRKINGLIIVKQDWLNIKKEDN